MTNPGFVPFTQHGRAEIAALFGNRQIAFPIREEAIRFCEDQPTLWRHLLQELERRSSVGAVFANLRESIDQAQFDTAARDDGETVVKAFVPLLTTKSVSRLIEISRISTETFNTVSAAVLIECRSIGAGAKAGAMPLDLLGSMLIYASGGALIDDIGRRLSEFETQMVQARTNAEEFSKSERASLASFKASLSEEVRLKSGTELWKDRARWHRGGSIAALSVFFCIVAALLYFGALHIDDVIKKLPRDKDMHIEYVSIALLAIPAVAAGWFLKLLARLVHTNSVLGDDARQRQAMARTYLALVADPQAQVTKEDRIVMLNAIFRPLPGSQTEEIAPPSILDLLKRGDH